MYKIKNISLREKAAIIYSIITGITDNVTFYTIAKGSNNYINKDSYSNMGSKLKSKDHIKQYYTEAQNIIDNYITSRIKQLQYNDNLDSGNNNGLLNRDIDSFTLKNINFTDPAEFINYLNNQANNIQDEKTKREYLKMLADLLRFKDGGNSGQESEIQRFYTPVTCKNCLLYNLKADEISQK